MTQMYSNKLEKYVDCEVVSKNIKTVWVKIINGLKHKYCKVKLNKLK